MEAYKNTLMEGEKDLDCEKKIYGEHYFERKAYLDGISQPHIMCSLFIAIHLL